MDYTIQEHCKNIDWTLVRDSLKNAGMAYCDPDIHKKAFQNSFSVVFVFHEGKMVGFGRALSDGAYQAAVYDIVVVPEFQNKGIGRMIMETILKKLPNCNTILYARPGKEEFYYRLGFRLMKTGLARFVDPARMEERNFI
ncbi:MAG: GNAT family N-acetyltransferase [Deltaproteobacteria bacterium]|nr:GNAT family N-acetyltransferase [Deltaproteobacteria bacterium]